MKNKFAVILAFVFLLVFLVPVSVFADDNPEEIPNVNTDEIMNELKDKGDGGYVVGPAGELIPVEEVETQQAENAGTVSEKAENGHQVIIEDGAALFSEEERQLLLEQLKELSSYGNMGIATSNEHNGDSAEYARSKYIELFGETSGTLFLIDMYNRRLQIFSGADMYNTISQVKANEITDNIYTYASAGDYYKTAQKAFEQIKIVLEGGRIVTPMRYATNAAFAIGLVLLINFIIVYNQRKKKASLRALTNALNYDNKNKRASVVKEVQTVMTKQRKTRHSSGGSGGFSGGGGGGFSGGGGGGGFSGGGGGHSF